MTAPDDWQEWREVWQEGRATEAALEQPVERVGRARRTLTLTSAAEAALVVAALGGLGAALRHAADAVEMALGLLVATAVIMTWAIHAVARRREAGAAAVAASEYVAVMRRLRRRQLQFVRFVWSVLALELVFLAWWWAGGIPVHRSELAAPIAILSLWIPIVAIAGFLAWTVRLYQRATHELRQLDRVQTEFGDE
jgi:hypothetical protein